MNHIPDDVIANAFGGVLAISPEIYAQMIDWLSREYGVPKEDVEIQVREVLATLPPYED